MRTDPWPEGKTAMFIKRFTSMSLLKSRVMYERLGREFHLTPRSAEQKIVWLRSHGYRIPYHERGHYQRNGGWTTANRQRVPKDTPMPESVLQPATVYDAEGHAIAVIDPHTRQRRAL